MQTVTHEYLVAKENASSYYQTSQTSWLNTVRPLVTPPLYHQFVAGDVTGSPAAYILMHRTRWEVNVSSHCVDDTILDGKFTANGGIVTCSLIDTVVTPSGVQVPTVQIPNLFAYNGNVGPARLVVTHTNTGWLIQADDSYAGD